MSQIIWSARIKDIPLEKFKQGGLRWASAVENRAVNNAPILTGALRRSAHIQQPSENVIEVEFGGSSSRSPHEVRYALRRHYENNKNPQTRYYLKRAVDSTPIERFFK